MILPLLASGISAFAISFIATIFVKRFAFQNGMVDRPNTARKIHKHPTARLGGLAIYLSFSIVVVYLIFFSDLLTGGRITQLHYLGMLAGGAILMIGGFFDDRYDLPPWLSFLSPVLATFVLIGSGIEIEKLTNPFGGFIFLTSVQSDILVFFWMMIVVYTTKFLDGLDGLATSVSSIGSLIIMLLAMSAAYFQPDVAVLSAISLGSFLGFLFWNFHPASIFLGEGGSTFVGYALATLAVISGGKLATALLVLGIPLLDVVWIIVRRWKIGGLRQTFYGDRKHLHHRLLDLGFGQRQIVFLYVCVSTIFGLSTLFLESRQKLIALFLLGSIMLIVAITLVKKEKVVESS